MKTATALMLVMFGPTLSWATSMSPPPPLAEIVKSSDHIFLGTIIAVDVIKPDGTVLSAPPSPLTRELRIRLTVTPEPQWVRTPLKKLPSVVSVTYEFGKFNLTHESERDKYLNKRWLFLLAGTDFHPAYFLSFAVTEDRLPEVMEIGSKDPVE